MRALELNLSSFSHANSLPKSQADDVDDRTAAFDTLHELHSVSQPGSRVRRPRRRECNGSIRIERGKRGEAKRTQTLPSHPYAGQSSANSFQSSLNSAPSLPRSLALSLSRPRLLLLRKQATNDLARRLSFSIALSLASLLSSVGVLVDAPAAALVEYAQKKPARLRSLLIA